MYRELDAAGLRAILRIDEDQLPGVLIVMGELHVQRAASRIAAYIEDPRELRATPGYLCRYNGLGVAVVGAFGAAMAANYVHLWCGAGVPLVFQLGWFGALQHGMDAGDVVVPHHAAREDGVSDWYLPKGILADATPELASAVAARLRARGINVNEGPLFTTPAMLAESREVIVDWSRHGWLGVDMETAATFAVAKHFGARRAAALILIDDLVGEKNSLADVATTRALAPLLREREEAVLRAVLDVAADAMAADAAEARQPGP
ncbi:MAG: hypothetical protein Kow0010_11330 [Dehalococcoidia bacterium]